MKKTDSATYRLRKKTGDWAGDLFIQADGFSRGAMGLSIEALRSLKGARGSEAAAAIAYYALFSLFPLLIILVVVGSTLLQNQYVQVQILSLVREVLPPGEEMVSENIQRILDMGSLSPAEDIMKVNVQEVMKLRLPMGILAAFGLLWSSTSVFTALARNVDRAWKGAARRNYWRWHLLGFAMAGGLMVGFLVVSLLLVGLLGLISRILGENIPFYEAWFLGALSSLVPALLVLVISFSLYLWAPNTDVRLQEAGWGALVATFGWIVSKTAFSWYLNIWMARQQLVYGSLGTVVVLMLWVYLSGMIILYGAHLSASIGQRRRMLMEEKADRPP